MLSSERHPPPAEAEYAVATALRVPADAKDERLGSGIEPSL